MKPERCVLCEASAECVLRAGSREYFHCAGCDLIFVPARQHLDPAAERARYERHENTMQIAGYAARMRAVVRLVRAFAPDATRVLDYGCGPGTVLVDLLRRAGFTPTGYDPIFAPDADLATPFDAVVSTETFEHFRSPRRDVRRVVACVREGGILAVQTLFHPGPAALADWWYRRDPTHVALYGRRTFDWIAERLELDVVFRDSRDLVVLRKRRPDRASAPAAVVSRRITSSNGGQCPSYPADEGGERVRL